MAIDREKLKADLQKKKEQRAAGSVEYIKKDSTRNLRVLEFTDEEGRTNFARTVVQFRLKSDTKTTIINRQKTLGAPCACVRLEELCSERNQESPFARQQTIYYVNAIDVDQKPHKVKIFQIPATVWEAIAEYLVSDEWADVLDQQEGHTFAISRTGEGLNTEYACVVARKPWPVSDALQAEVVDPLSAVVDPGIAGQCEIIGVDVEDLWQNPDDLEDFEPMDTKSKKKSKPSNKKEPAASKKISKKVSKKTQPSVKEGFKLGQQIECLHESGEWYPGKIASVEGNDEYGVTFDDGDEGIYGGTNIRLVDEGEADADADTPESYVGKAGVGVYPDDGEQYKCTVVEEWHDTQLIRVEWEDGSPASVIKMEEFEEDSIPFDSTPAVSDDDIPLPKRSGTAAEKSAQRFTKK